MITGPDGRGGGEGTQGVERVAGVLRVVERPLADEGHRLARAPGPEVRELPHGVGGGEGGSAWMTDAPMKARTATAMKIGVFMAKV